LLNVLNAKLFTYNILLLSSGVPTLIFDGKYERQIAVNKHFDSVIVHFSFQSNFRVSSGQTPLGRPPTPFPTNQTLCLCVCFSLLLCFKVASMSSITKGQGICIWTTFEGMGMISRRRRTRWGERDRELK
jgi:hypothetical protein